MAEYIERDMFLKIISCKPSSPTTDREDRLINYCISAVKNFPAADVRPVVRGKWTSVFDIGTVCNQCGYDIEEHGYDVRTDGEPNYCPNCGADMREVDDAL